MDACACPWSFLVFVRVYDEVIKKKDTPRTRGYVRTEKLALNLLFTKRVTVFKASKVAERQKQSATFSPLLFTIFIMVAH